MEYFVIQFRIMKTKDENNKTVRKNFKCKYCEKVYRQSSLLSRHAKNCKVIQQKLNIINSYTVFCISCKKSVKKQYLSQHQRSFEHLDSLAKLIEGKIELFNSALDKDIQEFRIVDADPFELDLKKLLNDNKESISNLISLELVKSKNLKFEINHSEIYRRISTETNSKNEHHLDALKTFHSDYYSINRSSEIPKFLDLAYCNLLKKIEDFKSNQSGWSICFSLQIGIQILKIAHFGSSYIQLPDKLKCNRNLINVINQDSYCLIWSILCHFYHDLFKEKHKKIDYRNYVKFRDEIVTTKLEFPLSFNEIKILEELNVHISLSINVYDYEDDSLGVVRVTEKEKQNHINLLLIYDDQQNAHYVFIKNLHRFVRPFLTSVRNNSEYFFCPNCLTSFKSPVEFEFHEKIKCLGTLVRFPANKEVSFNRQYAKEKHFMVFIADFETFNMRLEPTEDEQEKKKPENRHAFTQKLSKHQPLAAGYKIQSVIIDDVKLQDVRVFTGENCLKLFIDGLVTDAVYFYDRYLKKKAPKTPTNPVIEQALIQMDTCYVCNKSLRFQPNAIIIVDHLHLNCENVWLQDTFPKCLPNSNIRQLLHLSCNLKFRTKYIFYIIMHNFTAYDGLLILRYLLISSEYKKSIRIIAKNQNNFITASFVHQHGERKLKFVFIDSLNHLSGSLAHLTSQCPDQLHETKKYFQKIMPELSTQDQDKFRKLPQCYDYINSIELCNEIRPFPDKKCFANKLIPEYQISTSDYNFGKAIYEKHCKTLMDWVSIYMLVDIYLLFDLFLHYRRIILHFFHMDPVHMISAPQLSYNLMLDLAQRPFEICCDVNMLSLIFSNIRAGK